MNEYIKIGKITSTHGIKGELRIKSDFLRKDLCFKPGFIIYLGEEKIPEEITSYRYHKIYDMVTLKGYTNINEVLKYLKYNVYVKRSDLALNSNEYVLEDLINLEIVSSNTIYGKVVDFINNNGNILLVVAGKSKFYIPIKGSYIEKVDLVNKKIICSKVSDLILWKSIF